MKEREIQTPFALIWKLPAHGFAWEEAVRQPPGKGGRDTFLVEQQVALPRKTKLYDPLRECTGLFRIFAEIHPTRPGVLRFANEYGQLGGRYSETVLILASSKVSRSGRAASLAKGETLDAWANEISSMKAMVRLWDAARRGDTATLEKWIQWHDGEVRYDFKVGQYHAGGTLAAPDHYPEILDGLVPADVVQPAWHLLQRELNARLAEHPAMPYVVWDQDRSELRVRLKPRSLISALWLQFAFAVGENHSYRTCAACGKWFQVGPGADMRADAKHCSNACRQRKYREVVASSAGNGR